MARTKQTARMAAPGGPVAQLRYALQCEMMMLQEPKEPAAMPKRKRNHWADEVEPTHGAALNPRKKASSPEREGDARSALVDVLEHLTEALRLCLRAGGTDATTLFRDAATAEACLHRIPIPWGSNNWAFSAPGLVSFAEHAPLDDLRVAFDDLERADAGLAATYAYLEGAFAAFDEAHLPDPRALRLAHAIHAGSLATWPQLLSAAAAHAHCVGVVSN